MSFLDTLNQMLVILFAVAMGYVAHRLGYLGGEINQKLSKIVIHIGIPALTLAAGGGGAVGTHGNNAVSFAVNNCVNSAERRQSCNSVF